MFVYMSCCLQEMKLKAEAKRREIEEEQRRLEHLMTSSTNLPVQEEQNVLISTAVSLLWNLAPFILFASFLYIVQLVVKSS